MTFSGQFSLAGLQHCTLGKQLGGGGVNKLNMAEGNDEVQMKLALGISQQALLWKHL